MVLIIAHVAIRSEKHSINLTKKNARKGRSGGEKFLLDQLTSCGSVEDKVDVDDALVVLAGKPKNRPRLPNLAGAFNNEG